MARKTNYTYLGRHFKKHQPENRRTSRKREKMRKGIWPTDTERHDEEQLIFLYAQKDGKMAGGRTKTICKMYTPFRTKVYAVCTHLKGAT